MSEPSLLTLPNGIRIAHKEVPSSNVAHCGFTLDIGSRDETFESQGIAHFWEHMVFKGTRKRKAFHILNRLDSLGGELNAFTTKEKISFYASVMDQYFEKAVELLMDITFNSIFPQNQLEKERNVILEEMAMYRDSPEDSLHDEFDHVVFGGHPLGFNILGTDTSVKSFRREDFKKFLKEHIDTSRIVFSSVGPMTARKVFKLARKYLGDIPTIENESKRINFENYSPEDRVVKKEMTQALCAVGRTSYPALDEKRLPFFMLTNILGGPALNSRLNMALRERKGYVYSIDASYLPYRDTGMMNIIFGTDPKHLSRCLNAIKREMKLLCDKKMGIKQLSSAKEQLMGQIAMAEEKNVSFMLMMGKSLLDQNRIESMDEIFKRIKNIKSQDLLEVANEMYNPDEMSSLIYRPN